MHVSRREIDKDGTHIITSVLEADGPTQLASDKATLSAKVIGVQRTDSGGIQVQTAVTISEPTPIAVALVEVKAAPTRRELAVAYFVEKGFTKDAAEKSVERFGEDRVIRMREQELDAELANAVGEHK